LRAGFAGDGAGAQIVLAAGRFSPEKGFGVLVEAAATICRENASAGVVLFGEGPLRSTLERRVAELGLRGRVVLPGFRTDLDSLIGGADVVVLPSYTEGLPNVALEASAAGVPVVATAVGGTPEAIADGVNGALVPPGQPASIARKVGELLRDTNLRARFGAAGRARMRALFTFQAQAAAYLRLLRTFCPTPAELVAR
jgi:glycosyltransferase involved in cell wall biosynthesis